jgi:hypothetical protein
MSNRYPSPSYAITLWLSGDRIMLALPEASIVEIPLERFEAVTNDFGNVLPVNRGVAVLLDILRSRAQSRQTIAQPGAPLRYSVESALESDEKYKAWLVAMSENKVTKAEAKEFLSGLGL